MNNIPWWGYVILAGLSWGVYVPLIFFGGQLLTPDGKGIGGRLASILCVGVAYFLLAVLIPLALMATQENATPNWRLGGLVFSGLAGVAGAIGAICVIFASKAAMDQARIESVDAATYRRFIAPLIFALAPAINTFLSLFWHPNAKTGEWYGEKVLYFEMPGWKLPLGILFVAIGTFLVLFSKEEAEAHKGGPKPVPVAEAPPAT